MNRSFLDVLTGRNNIRIRIFWNALLSFLLLVEVSWLLAQFSLDFGGIGNFLLWTGLFLFFFYLFMRPIVRRLRALSEGVMSIAHGDLDYRLRLSSQDELGSVARNINYMAEQLQTMMERERKLETSKMELISHVSHDLRTPLTSIIGYLNLLKNDDYSDMEEHKRYIANAFNKSQQLKKLIDDLFEYTRLTSGDVQVSFQSVDLSALLDQIVLEYEPIAQEHALSVAKDWESAAVCAELDAEKFVRAVDNLLMNALKFSEKPGEITVRLFQRAEHIYVAVENRGTPVTREQEMRLFERFYKAEPSRADSVMASGAGLGLSIARNIVELHGGRLGLRHRDGHFTFYIELPRADELLQK